MEKLPASWSASIEMLSLAERYESELPKVIAFRISEVADLLSVSDRSARRYIDQGHLRPIGLTGSPRVTLAELIRFSKESPLALKGRERNGG